MTSDARISELEHSTGQVLPCSWDGCPTCREITVTHLTIDSAKFAQHVRCDMGPDEEPQDLTKIHGIFVTTTKRWWE